MAETISSAEFETKVLQAPGKVLVDFCATWCGPCKMLSPVLDEIADELAGEVVLYKIDVDQSPDVAMTYGITAVPTVIAFEGGRLKASAVGVQPKENILALLK